MTVQLLAEPRGDSLRELLQAAARRGLRGMVVRDVADELIAKAVAPEVVERKFMRLAGTASEPPDLVEVFRLSDSSRYGLQSLLQDRLFGQSDATFRDLTFIDDHDRVAFWSDSDEYRVFAGFELEDWQRFSEGLPNLASLPVFPDGVDLLDEPAVVNFLAHLEESTGDEIEQIVTESLHMRPGATPYSLSESLAASILVMQCVAPEHVGPLYVTVAEIPAPLTLRLGVNRPAAVRTAMRVLESPSWRGSWRSIPGRGLDRVTAQISWMCQMAASGT